MSRDKIFDAILFVLTIGGLVLVLFGLYCLLGLCLVWALNALGLEIAYGAEAVFASAIIVALFAPKHQTKQ